MDGGGENKKITKALLENYKVHRIVVSAYHPQANGLVEYRHDAIVNSLSKYCSQNPEKWVENLPLALWADRISVRRTMGYSAFELLYGRDCLLPIDISLPSWSVVDWEGEVTDRESLLVARMRQLDQRSLYEAQASTNLKNSRLSNKSDFDASKRMRAAAQQLRVGDLVLLHNMILSILIHVNLTTSGTALFESARFPKIRLFIDWKSWMAPHSLLLSLETVSNGSLHAQNWMRTGRKRMILFESGIHGILLKTMRKWKME